MSFSKCPLGTFLVASLLSALAWSVSFQPISPDELKMTSEPQAPGAPAIILLREVDRDDRGLTAHEDVYLRIKILTEDGRKYGDVEIPFIEQQGRIVNIHARTIHPDGTEVNFYGKPFDKLIVKARGMKYMAKTFTFPDVQVGCILEYFYTTDFAERILFDSHWILSEDLFSRTARFSLKPYQNAYHPFHLRWSWNKLPPGTALPVEAPNHVITLEASNIPAFQAEDYMPPENEMKSRVDFIYSEDLFELEPANYWKRWGQKRNAQLEGFIGKRKSMEEAISTIISSADSSEVKLRKIYTRVQQVRNTSYEEAKTEQEQQRAKEKNPDNVETIWKKQYGNGQELTWLFLALARAAGFEAYGMWVPDRLNYFFVPEMMDGNRLDANVVMVKLNGKELFFDPGAAFTPFGMLPWNETAVKGLKLDKEGGSWVATPLPESSESSIRRKGDLKLTDTGDLEGRLLVTYTGLEATERRVETRLADDTDRKKFLEEEVRETIPAACEVELSNQPNWRSTDPLKAEFTLKVPGWVSAAGSHALFPLGLFSAPEKHLFDHAERVQPIYFQFPFQRADDVSVELPVGWRVSTVPPPQRLDAKAIVYVTQAKKENNLLRLSRSLDLDIMLLPAANYGSLRRIFQSIRTGDEQQIMLEPGTTAAAN